VEGANNGKHSACYVRELIMAVKSFIVHDPGTNLINFLYSDRQKGQICESVCPWQASPGKCYVCQYGRSFPSLSTFQAYPTRVGSQLYCETLDLGWKGMAGTNTLAYLAHSYVNRKKLYNIGLWL
jgi:hypothetical protein